MLRTKEKDMKWVNNSQALGGSKMIRGSTKVISSSRKFIDYFLLLLIFIFFLVPLAGLSLHYYRFGLPPSLRGFFSFLTDFVKGFIG